VPASSIGHYEPVDARPINEHEAALVAALLAPPFEGFEELRAQIPGASVIPGCECGCGTIDFVFGEPNTDLPRSAAANPVSRSPTILDGDGNVIGSLILFLREGLLQSLEVVSYLDPLPLPSMEQVDWATAP
jgi:hypothetical protein